MKIIIFFFFSLFLSANTNAQIKILKNKEGILVLRLSTCNKTNDEYCITGQDIYFGNTRHTVADYHLLKELKNILSHQNQDNRWANPLLHLMKTDTGFYKLFLIYQ